MGKKYNRFSINLTDKAARILRALGYIDGWNRVNKNRNLSHFISGLIVEKFTDKNKVTEIELQSEIARLVELQAEQKRLAEEIQYRAERIKALKKRLNKDKGGFENEKKSR